MRSAELLRKVELLSEAEGKRKAADKAHRAGDATLRDAFPMLADDFDAADRARADAALAAHEAKVEACRAAGLQ